MSSTSKNISARKVVITSFLVSALDVGSGLIVALLTGSVVMIAQVLQGLADLAAAGFLVVGVKQANKPADKRHPFGHGREVYFWAMLSALIMFSVTAGLSFYLGLERLWEPEPINNVVLAYVLLIITTLTNGYSFSLSLKRISKRGGFKKSLTAFLQSPLIETKTTFVLDLMGTAAAVLGLISLVLYGITGDLHYDGLGAMIIGLVLGFMALLLIKAVKDLLVGKSASPEDAEKIREATLHVKQVRDVLDLRTMYLGPEKLLVNLEVHLQDNLTTDEIEILTDKIKDSVKNKVPTVDHIQVEIETPE